MIEIQYRELHKILLSKFDLGPLPTELMSRITAGAEKADDYEELCKHDRFFTETICRMASASMRTSVVTSLGHGVVLLGQQKIRNMVLGHTLTRLFSTYADNNFLGLDATEKILRYASRSEEHARKCGNEYLGLAFAAGYVFDLFSQWIASEGALTALLQEFFDQTWKHSLNTATLAWELASHERVLISHRKIIFTSGLLHDIGKLGLAVYQPGVYASCLEKMKKLRDDNPDDDAYEGVVEREHFDLSHPEIGSAIVFETKFLKDIETEVDFHHDSTILKTRNPDAFLGCAVINIADRVAWLMERRNRFTVDDLQKIIKPHASYFPLGAGDIMTMFASLRGKGLLTA